MNPPSVTITNATLLANTGATIAVHTFPAPLTLISGDSVTITWTWTAMIDSGMVPRAYDPSLDVLRPEGE